ncbi:hypothetical protein FACS1894101_2340 [Betaproteobacteria bacterium]|nr:hypothetical protein FACS1894101_2340 [Betaproteobacteria bacterium]
MIKEMLIYSVNLAILREADRRSKIPVILRLRALTRPARRMTGYGRIAVKVINHLGRVMKVF